MENVNFATNYARYTRKEEHHYIFLFWEYFSTVYLFNDVIFITAVAAKIKIWNELVFQAEQK